MESSTENFQLSSLEQPEDGRWEEDFAQSGEGFSLPPTDRGWQAWSFLAVCFIVEALVWGRSSLNLKLKVPFSVPRIVRFS